MTAQRFKYFTNCLLLLLVLVFSAFIHLFKISEIPGEWFGDITEVHEFVLDIYAGRWPYLFRLGNGPLYPYLAFPILHIFRNQGYETYKYTSAVVSLLGLIPVYLFFSETVSKKAALISVLIMGSSFWYLVWSRLGNVQVIIPAVVSLYSYFLIRFYKLGRLRDLFWGGVIASLGWYIYTPTFIFPFIYLLFYFLILLRKKVFVKMVKLTIVFASLLFMLTLPFVFIVQGDSALFTEGYIGKKFIPVFGMNVADIWQKTRDNFQKTLFMFHSRGDVVFRWNVSREPLFDRISGVFMVLGLLNFFGKGKRVRLFFIVVSLFLLCLPSISPVLPEDEIPSSVRTIGSIPFTYLLVGAGFVWTLDRLRFIFPRRFIYIFMGILLMLFMVRNNIQHYFISYADGLPEHNLAPSKGLARYIDTLPDSTYVYFSSCCWGDWGEPEPAGIIYSLHKPKHYSEFAYFVEACEQVVRIPAVIVFSPYESDKLNEFKRCNDSTEERKIYSDDGREVASILYTW